MLEYTRLPTTRGEVALRTERVKLPLPTVTSWRNPLRSIFLSYRRNDSEGEAGRLFDDLTLRFHHDLVFMDVAAIEPGRDFRKAIDQNVASCSVLLAMIGQDWLNSNDALGNRRLEDPSDFLRMELASALRCAATSRPSRCW